MNDVESFQKIFVLSREDLECLLRSFVDNLLKYERLYYKLSREVSNGEIK